MSEIDKLSPIARQALERDCKASGVPLILTDPVIIERIVALLRAPVDNRVRRRVNESPEQHKGE